MMAMIAYSELKKSFSLWRIWTTLALQDIKLRYRRSTLGPFWITMSMAITICCMGFLYSYLFQINLHQYFPYLASGIISWGLVAGLVNESPSCFIDSENYIKNINLPFTTFLLQLTLRNLIIFMHNLLVFLPIIYFFNVQLNAYSLFIFLGVFILTINSVCYGTVLAIIGVRYRDFPQIAISLTQVGFFLTPIMWSEELLPDRLLLPLEFNPFYQILNLVRKPMLGELLTSQNLLAISILTFIGVFLFYFVTKKYKDRVVFWL